MDKAKSKRGATDSVEITEIRERKLLLILERKWQQQKPIND